MRSQAFFQSAVFYWLCVALWCALIFVASSVPDPSQSGTLQTWDDILNFIAHKAAHIVEYAVLMLLTEAAIRKTDPQFRGRFLASFLFVLAYAISDEWHQSFVYGRIGTVRDVFIDCVGAFLAGIYLIRTQKPPHAPEAEPGP